MAARTRLPAGDAPAPHDAAGAQAGYVLIEALAALSITLMILGFALPRIAPGTNPTRLLALVSSSASLLRDARTDALAGNRPVAARFDAARRRLSAGANSVPIPADVAFDLVSGGNCPAGDGKAEILFRPDGSNCGGVLRFAKGGRVLRTRVNWADGRVDVLDGG